MKLTKELVAELAVKTMEDKKLTKERALNKKRYLMYHGSTREVIEAAICSEFTKKETIIELLNRLVPLNISQTIINKLAGVYKEAPVRAVRSKDEREQEMLDAIAESMDLNIQMKEANRYFKLFKKVLLEPFLGDNGDPSLRVFPAHQYECYSIGTKKKSVPNVVVKIDEVAEQLIMWTDESHVVCTFKGEVIADEMKENPEWVNPYGVLQFVYINESSTSVNPIQDDDLLGMSIAIPVILTDLLFGLKYQCWAIIWTVGKVGDIPFNPNSVIQMDFGEEPGQEPSVNQIKPEIDSDKMLSVVMALVSLLLTTKNLKSGAITSSVTADAAASGVAKILDSAESTEDKKDQQAYFFKGERALLARLAPMMRYWKSTNQLSQKYSFELPQDFEVSVVFREPRPMMTDKERIETSAMIVEKKFSTVKRELKNIYPDYGPEEIDALYLEILEEAKVMAGLKPDLTTLNTEGTDGVES